MIRATLRIALSGSLIAVSSLPVAADYSSAKGHFDRLSARQQVDLALDLIATGDFDGLLDFGFTRRLYAATRKFEQREGLTVDGILQDPELKRLREKAEAFYADLGATYYSHPAAASKLLVPRKLFDHEKRDRGGILFTRDDRNLSLSYIAFPSSQRTFEQLYATMTANTRDRMVTYRRRFKSHFVVTGSFEGHKFYTWIHRLESGPAGFTVSWGEPWDDMGHKLSALLANTFQAQGLTPETPRSRGAQ
jgi:hypothetical protein